MGGSNSKEKNNKKAASVEEKNLAAEVNNGDQDNVIENIESTQTALVDVNADATCDTMPEGEVTITDNVAQMEDHHKDSINDPDCKTGTSQAVTGAVGKIDNTECCSPETVCSYINCTLLPMNPETVCCCINCTLLPINQEMVCCCISCTLLPINLKTVCSCINCTLLPINPEIVCCCINCTLLPIDLETVVVT